MVDSPMELVIVPTPGAEPVRMKLTRVLSTIGSSQSADLRLPTVPDRWVVVQRNPQGGLLARALATGVAHQLAPGQTVVIDGVSLSVAAAPGRGGGDRTPLGLPVEHLAEELSLASGPHEALCALLRTVVHATAADGGAIILREGGSYTVPVAETADGSPLGDAESLLSDTLVRDVLELGEPLRLSDAAAHERYALVPSVISMRLRSVLCVPLALGKGVLGAIYLGKRDLTAAFAERHAEDLSVVGAMVAPLLVQLRRARVAPASAAAPAQDQPVLVGECPAMDDVRRLVARVAPSSFTVLIHGATGSGKDVVARAIHAASARAGQPMVALNCAAVPEGLLASELFGARKGAFTGAVADRKGRIEQAHGSTLFLDEVGDMPLSMQAALLRVLEEKTVTRLGDTLERPVDYRLVAATHRDLDAEVAAGTFRQDLLYRLRELTITLPPLSERGADVLLLAQLFLRRAEAELGLGRLSFDDAATALLRRHRWPGNVRELRSAVRRAALLTDDGTIAPVHLQLGPDGEGGVGTTGGLGPVDLDRPLAEAKDTFVARYVSAVLEKNGGNREAAAAALGISLRSLYRYLA